MSDLKGFSLANYLRAAEVVPTERRLATFHHIARLEHILETQPFPFETTENEEPAPRTFFLGHVLPAASDNQTVLSSGHIKSLEEAAVEAIGNIRGGRWHQDGITF